MGRLKRETDTIYSAAKKGDLETVIRMVRNKEADPFQGDATENGKNIIHFAALFGHKRLTEYLVNEVHIDINERDFEKHTPLHEASWGGSVDVIQFLLQNGADVNAQDTSGETALHKAAGKGNFEVINLLVKNGINVLIRDNKRRHASEIARFLKFEKIKQFLERIEAEMADEHTESSKEADASEQISIFRAAEVGNFGALKRIVVEERTDPRVGNPADNGKTALHIASAFGHKTIVQYLVNEQHMDANVVDNDKHTPLHEAAYGGSLEVVQFLLENGAFINALDIHKETALHKAAWKGHWAVVNFLVQSGVDVFLEEKRGDRASIKAKINHQDKVYKYLVRIEKEQAQNRTEPNLDVPVVGKKETRKLSEGLPEVKQDSRPVPSRAPKMPSLLGGLVEAAWLVVSRSRDLLTDPKSTPEPRESQILGACAATNANLGLLLAQTYLSKKCPVPHESPFEALDYAEELVVGFERGLKPRSLQ